MNQKTAREIEQIMAELLGDSVSKKLVDSVKKFDDPKEDPKAFYDSCRKVFAELIGEETFDKKMASTEKQEAEKNKKAH